MLRKQFVIKVLCNDYDSIRTQLLCSQRLVLISCVFSHLQLPQKTKTENNICYFILVLEFRKWKAPLGE